MAQVAQAVPVQAVPVPTVTTGGGLRADDLVNFFEGPEAREVSGKVAEMQQTKMQWLQRLFDNSDVQSVREAAKGYLQKFPKDSKPYKVAKVRASEIRQIYGAHRFGGLSLLKIGYDKAVEEARDILSTKAIRWTGDPIPTEKDKQLRANKAQGKAIREEADGEIGAKQMELGRVLTAMEMAELLEQAATRLEAKKLRQTCFNLIDQFGPDRIAEIMDDMPAALLEYEQMHQNEIDKALQKQALADTQTE